MIYGMKIHRASIELQLKSALNRSSAVVLLGPRQVGKTTLAKKIVQELPDAIYLDLEKAADLRKLDDSGGFLRHQDKGLTVLDEVHRVPQLFAELRSVIDERREKGAQIGQFLLLGSASLDLIQKASETLAGRVSYLEMTPVLLPEAQSADLSTDALWLAGGFPSSLTATSRKSSLQWRTDFIRSYLERDIPMFAPRMPAALLGRLWTMLAHLQGTPLNATRLAQNLGVSAPMVNRYIDLLVDLLLIRRVSPWSGNLGKRLVKAPKIYIRDSGLVHALLEIETNTSLLGHPIVGASWEGFAIENLVQAAGLDRLPMYFRTHDGAEIDLIFERGGLPYIAVEIKRSSAPKIETSFITNCELLRIEHRFLVCNSEDTYIGRAGVNVLNLPKACEAIRDLFIQHE
jgi:uncharacterized protein